MEEQVRADPPWRAANKRYYAANRERENRDRKAQTLRKWRAENKERVKRANEEWARRNPERFREIRRRAALKSRLKRRGICLEQYETMLEAQGHVCAICRSDTTGTKHDWHIDHDHCTGEVRGLLCHHCNTALGHAKDDPSILRSMIEYLERTARWKGK
jgi:hypothetical protein